MSAVFTVIHVTSVTPKSNVEWNPSEISASEPVRNPKTSLSSARVPPAMADVRATCSFSLMAEVYPVGRSQTTALPCGAPCFQRVGRGLMKLEKLKVIIGDKEKHPGEQHDADDLDGRLHLQRQRLAADFLEDQQQEQPAVDNGQREKIGDRKIHADHRHQIPKPGHAAFLHVVADLGDAQHAVKVVGRNRAA